MNQIALNVLPCNRARVQKFIASPRLAVVDYLVRSVLQNDVLNDPDIVDRFNDYVTWEESVLRENLARFQWDIDASNTLSLIIGGRRVEKVSFTLSDGR